MVVSNIILNQISNDSLNLIKNKINQIQIGDNGTTPSPSDTSIGNLVANLPVDSIDETVMNQITSNSRAGITIGNGSTIREIVQRDSSDTSNIITRNLTTEMQKGNDQVFWFQIRTRINVRNA